MKIRVFDLPSEAGLYAASLIERVVETTQRPVFGLATGSTTLPLYDALVNLDHCGLNLSSAVTINLDEYIGLGADHEQSYHYFMNQHLFSRLRVRPKEMYIPSGDGVNPQAECQRYDAVIREHPIDLQVLGIGTNGHIGFNEPDDLLLLNTHIVNLSANTIQSNARFFQSPDEVPRQALTMGVQAILQAKQIVLMAFGEEKADIIAKMVDGEVRTEIPASVLQLHRDVTLVLDKASAAKLTVESLLR